MKKLNILLAIGFISTPLQAMENHAKPYKVVCHTVEEIVAQITALLHE